LDEDRSARNMMFWMKISTNLSHHVLDEDHSTQQNNNMFWMKIGQNVILSAKLLITMALALHKNIMFWMKITKKFVG
jgi:hypothetical protein